MRFSVFIAVFASLAFSGIADEVRRPPNIVLILADDLGWRDVGFMGNRQIDTPALDRLAASGLVFNQAYAAAPNCAPSRASLLTGQYAPRHGIYTVVDPRHVPGSPRHRLLAAESRADLTNETVTLPEVLHTGGYATALVGMWNLGRGRAGESATPTGQGFDFYSEPKRLGFAQDAYKRDDGAYLSDAMTDEAIRWVGEHRSGPFFLYFAPHDVHEPYDPKADLLAKYKARPGVSDPAMAATVEALDTNIGRLLAALRDLGLADNTHVIFTSDNGGTRRFIAPLRGGKGTLYEGGLRVPAVWSGPGVRPGGTTTEPVSGIDFFPTIVALTGLRPPASAAGLIDGVSLLPLRDGRGTLKRERLFWHFPCYMTTTGPMSAVREGSLKLIEQFDPPALELYDLAADPGEQHNLASSRPEVAARLHATLQGWQTALGAPCPSTPNPAYDPKAPRPENPRRNKTTSQP